MSEDLAEYVDGVPARFVPEEMRGELVEAEHLSRYWWAGGLVAERRVLDAGCGVGYGSLILADAGARDVIGVDVAEAVVSAASAHERPGLRFEQSDVAHLELDDGSVDTVVCFEVIEHVDEPEAALDEFARVLAPSGVLAISSPNRDEYIPGNPHHEREFTPDEFAEALGRRWRHVRLLRQHNWIGSAILNDRDTASADGLPVEPPQVRKVFGVDPGTEPYTVALASDDQLPDPPPVMALTGVTEVRRWLEHYDTQQRILDEQRQALNELETVNRERNELRARLIECETELARIPELEAELEQGAWERDRLMERLDATSQALQDVMSSPSWRITAPLRVAKRRFKSSRG